MIDALGLHDLALFALTVLVLNATPGVDMVFVVSRTLAGGWRAGLAGGLGVCAGCVVHVLAAAFGLAALLAVSGWAFAAIKWAGAAYLVWLAVGMWRAAWRAAPGTPGTPGAAAGPAPGVGASFRQGLLTNVLNPKVALFVLALLPQFIDPASPHKTLAFLALGAWFVVQGALFLLVLVAATVPLRRVGASPTLARALQALGGTLFMVLAWRLARSEWR